MLQPFSADNCNFLPPSLLRVDHWTWVQRVVRNPFSVLVAFWIPNTSEDSLHRLNPKLLFVVEREALTLHTRYRYNHSIPWSRWSPLNAYKDDLCLPQTLFQIILSLKFLFFGDGKEWLWGEWRRPLLMLTYFFSTWKALFESSLFLSANKTRLKASYTYFRTVELINVVQV